MKANLGILPPLATKIRNKAQRKQAYAERAARSMCAAISDLDDQVIIPQVADVLPLP